MQTSSCAPVLQDRPSLKALLAQSTMAAEELAENPPSQCLAQSSSHTSLGDSGQPSPQPWLRLVARPSASPVDTSCHPVAGTEQSSNVGHRPETLTAKMEGEMFACWRGAQTAAGWSRRALLMADCTARRLGQTAKSCSATLFSTAASGQAWLALARWAAVGALWLFLPHVCIAQNILPVS